MAPDSQRDEVVAREIEHRLGHAFTPSVRAAAVAHRLDKKGRHETADMVRVRANIDAGRREPKKRVLQAERVGSDRERLDGEVLALWIASGRDLRCFSSMLEGTDYGAAQGDKVIMLVHRPTGDSWPLRRQIARLEKREGRRLSLSAREFARVFQHAPPLATATKAPAAERLRDAHLAVQAELTRWAAELEADDAKVLAGKVRRRADGWRHAAKIEATAIRAGYRRRDLIRRRRVDRAFKAARILDRPDVRRAAFWLAATGIMMTGAGLVAALVAAGAAVQFLPARDDARRIAADARREKEHDRVATNAAVQQAFAEAKSKKPVAQPAPINVAAGKLRRPHSRALQTLPRSRRPQPDWEIGG